MLEDIDDERARCCDEDDDGPRHASGDHPALAADPAAGRDVDHVLVHTGQNYDPNLSECSSRSWACESRISTWESGATSAPRRGSCSADRAVFAEHRPDRLLILGDTNSGLVSIVARRIGIPVYHMEAGNRCYDDRVPEEINRRIIDHSSSVLLPYTHRSKENLVREGIDRSRIFVTGNPIKQVIDHYGRQIDTSDVLGAAGAGVGSFFLVTMHRAENVDVEPKLRGLVEALAQIHGLRVSRGVLVPPANALEDRAVRHRIERGPVFLEPLGFFDFVRLERRHSASCPTAERCRRRPASSCGPMSRSAKSQNGRRRSNRLQPPVGLGERGYPTGCSSCNRPRTELGSALGV